MLVVLAIGLLVAGTGFLIGAFRMPESTMRFVLWTIGTLSNIAGVVILVTGDFAK